MSEIPSLEEEASMEEAEMDQVHKDRNAALADDLESGRFVQGKGVLHHIVTLLDGSTQDEWCCLGVASHQAAEDGVEVSRTVITTTGGTAEGFDGNLHVPPQPVVDYYGWSSKNPLLIAESGRMVNAVMLNDHGETYGGEPYDFPRIAAAFRRTFCQPAPETSDGI